MKNPQPSAKFLVVQPLLGRFRQLTPGPAAEPDWGVWKAGPYTSSVLGDGCIWAGAAVVWSAGCMITWGCDGCGDVSGGAASDGSVSDGTVWDRRRGLCGYRRRLRRCRCLPGRSAGGLTGFLALCSRKVITDNRHARIYIFK